MLLESYSGRRRGQVWGHKQGGSFFTASVGAVLAGLGLWGPQRFCLVHNQHNLFTQSCYPDTQYAATTHFTSSRTDVGGVEWRAQTAPADLLGSRHTWWQQQQKLPPDTVPD